MLFRSNQGPSAPGWARQHHSQRETPFVPSKRLLVHLYYWASLVAQLVKNPPAMQVDSIPGSGRSPGKGIGYPLQYSWASLVAQMVKNPPAMQETKVRSLGWEDSLEKGVATHSSILAWRIPWTIWNSVGSLESMGPKIDATK